VKHSFDGDIADRDVARFLWPGEETVVAIKLIFLVFVEF